jgi:hypothetical protein
MKNISTEVVKKIKTHVLYAVIFFFEDLAVYEITWKNIVQPDRPQMAIWRMHVACWIPKATNTKSEYVILIVFTLQQWLDEGSLPVLSAVIFDTFTTS